jgi:hypothetical protein
MSLSRKSLCVIYALIAIFALAGTWTHNAAYLHLGWLGANVAFWRDTLVNPASASITVDIFFFGLAANLWMVLEARRIALKGVWLYVIAGALVAISVSFPLFMLHRERVLASRGETPASELRAGDTVGLLALASMVIAFTLWTFQH